VFFLAYHAITITYTSWVVMAAICV